MSRSIRRCVRVLLAEDEPSNQKVTMLMLKKLGYEADAVTNGVEALQAFESQSYDLFLTNLAMPRIDGLEATRQIRKLLPAESQPKIIAITAYVLPDGWNMCFEAGMDDYIIKPVDIYGLALVLNKHVPLSRQ